MHSAIAGRETLRCEAVSGKQSYCGRFCAFSCEITVRDIEAGRETEESAGRLRISAPSKRARRYSISSTEITRRNTGGFCATSGTRYGAKEDTDPIKKLLRHWRLGV